MEELKPCPFCGDNHVEVYIDPDFRFDRYKVCCVKCAAQIYRGDKDKAVEAWNTRQSDGRQLENL